MGEFGPLPPRQRPKQDLDVLALQMDQWSRARAGQRAWAEAARECVDFSEGRQYSKADLAALAAARVPALTLNKIGPLMRLMYGFYRGNRYEIRFQAGSDGTGSDEVADVLTALSKHIDTDNRSKWLDAEVFDDGLVTGRGYWDIRVDFSRNVLGEVRERALDPFSVYPDPEGDSYDPESWNHVHVTRWASLDDIALLYGDGARDEVQALGDGPMAVAGADQGLADSDEIGPARFFAGWDPFEQQLGSAQLGGADLPVGELVNRHRKLVRLVESQHRMLRKVRRFVDLTTGQIRVIPDHWSRERIVHLLDWANGQGERIMLDEAMVKCVRFTVSAANLVLHDEWSPYRRFTVVPFFAQFRHGETRGMVKDLVDPQREINKRRSAILQVLMTTPNSGWSLEENSLTEESKAALETHGGAPGLILEYKQGAQPPERIQVSGVPQGYVAAEGMATNDLKEIAGVNEAAMGQLDKVMSGRAVEARQRSAYVGAELFFDNFARSLELKGRLRLELVQDYYTEARLFRVPNHAGQDQQLLINWRDAAGEIVNDVSCGTYHCSIDTAPISATFLQGAFEEAMELKTLGVPIPNDVLIELSSIPLKRRILDQLQQQPAPPPSADMVLAQAQMLRAQNEPQIQSMKVQAQLQGKAMEGAVRQQVEAERMAAQAHFAPEPPATAAVPILATGGSLPQQLQRNADAAYASGNIAASTGALTALERLTERLRPVIEPPPFKGPE